MKFKKWLQRRMDPQGYALQEAVNERVAEILEGLADGKELADLAARIVDGPPVWDRTLQAWTVHDHALKEHRPIVLVEGRGGKEHEDAYIMEAVSEPDSEGARTYTITFDMPEEATNAS